MEVDKLISKWDALARKDVKYLESSKFRAIRSVLKELSVRDRLEEDSRRHMLELNLRGNHPELKGSRLDDLDLDLVLQALEELNTSNSVILDLQFNCISDAGMESLSKYLEVPKQHVLGGSGSLYLTTQLCKNLFYRTTISSQCIIDILVYMHCSV